MKKVVIVTLLLLVVGSLALSQAKPGGIARQAAMGGSQAGTGLVLNPFIMDDPALMLLNPAYQGMYKDYSWSNIAGGNLTGTGGLGEDGYGLQNAGVAFNLGGSSLGAIFSYDPSAVNTMGTILAQVVSGRAAQSIPNVQNVWELVGSTNMGSTSLGVGLSYGWSGENQKASVVTPASSSEADASARVLGLRAGLVADIGTGSSLDLSAALRLDKAQDNITSSAGSLGEFSASGTEMQFAARAKFKATEKFNFVPYGMLALMSAEPKEDHPFGTNPATNNTYKYSATGYAVGLGGEFQTKSYYLAGGLSFQALQVKDEISSPAPPAGPGPVTLTAKYTALPVVNLGGEWFLTDWLTGRIGYFRSIGTINYKTETVNGTDENSGTATPPTTPGFPFSIPFPGVHSFIAVGGLNPSTWDGVVTLGVGVKFGGFALDATMSDEALRRGVGLIGASDNINTFGYMTASYNFAE